MTKDNRSLLRRWMSAICADFVVNLGNICERVYSLFLILSVGLAVLWRSSVTT